MSSLSRELVFLILQFLDEEKFKETVHKLEQESSFFFNMKYFEDQVQAGEWDEVERYLSGFTKVEDNRYSMKIFFEIRKQKYLEALDKSDRAKAVEILVKDLKVFASFNEDLFKEITQLLTLENFRQNEQLSKYGDTKSARNIMLVELKKLIEANPLFRDKLAFPTFKASRLRTLINQSLNWQHQLCKNPRSNPDIKTLFTDHTCSSSNGARAPPLTNSLLTGPVAKPGTFPPLGAHGPFQPVVSPSPSAIAGWMSGANHPMPHAAVAAGPPGMVQAQNAVAFLKHPRTPPGASAMDHQTTDSEHLMKRLRVGQPDEVSFSGSAHSPNVYSLDDLPKTVARNLSQGSNVMSLDFHPQQQTVLLEMTSKPGSDKSDNLVISTARPVQFTPFTINPADKGKNKRVLPGAEASQSSGKRPKAGPSAGAPKPKKTKPTPPVVKEGVPPKSNNLEVVSLESEELRASPLQNTEPQLPVASVQELTHLGRTLSQAAYQNAAYNQVLGQVFREVTAKTEQAHRLEVERLTRERDDFECQAAKAAEDAAAAAKAAKEAKEEAGSLKGQLAKYDPAQLKKAALALVDKVVSSGTFGVEFGNLVELGRQAQLDEMWRYIKSALSPEAFKHFRGSCSHPDAEEAYQTWMREFRRGCLQRLKPTIVDYLANHPGFPSAEDIESYAEDLDTSLLGDWQRPDVGNFPDPYTEAELATPISEAEDEEAEGEDQEQEAPPTPPTNQQTKENKDASVDF